MKLYELTEGYCNLMELLTDESIDNVVVEDALREMDASIEDKAEGYAKIRLSLEAEIVICETEVERLQKMIKIRKNRSKFLLDYLAEALTVMNKTEVSTSIGKWFFRRNPPAVKVLDEKLIPQEYWVQAEPRLSKEMLQRDLRKNKVIPGVVMEQGKSLGFR